jgi:hypothetical protein
VYVLRLTANDGALSGSDTVTITVSPASSNTAVDLNGSSAFVALGQAPGLGSATFTLEAWFKREGAGVATSTGSGGVTAIPLVTKGMAQADGTNVDMNYFLGIRSSDGVLAADFEDTAGGGNHPVFGTTAIPANGVWHHAAVTLQRHDLAHLSRYVQENEPWWELHPAGRCVSTPLPVRAGIERWSRVARRRAFSTA